MRMRGIGIAIVILGVFLVLTPWRLFPVCRVNGFMSFPSGHGCANTARAETALGFAAIILGGLPLFKPKRGLALFASVSALALALLVVLFPLAITGLCKAPTMACRVGTLPALIVIAFLLGLTGLVGIGLFRKPP